MDRERLLDDETAGWTMFRAALDAVPQERWGEPTVTPEGWTVVSTVVHVAGWLDACGRALEAMAAGSFDPSTDPAATPGGLDRVNAEQALRAVGMDAATAEGLLASARSRARSALESLPELDPAAWAWFEESGPMHYAKHVHDLTSWSRGVASDPQVGELLQAETDAWVPFAAGVTEVAPERRLERDAEGWSLVDTLWHLARWQELTADAVADNVGWRPEGGADVASAIDALNEGFLVGSRDRTYDEARRALEDARTRLRDALAGLTEPTEEAKQTFADNTTEHYEEHLPMLWRLAGPA